MKLNSKTIKTGRRDSPAAAGDGTPTKYNFESILLGAKYISAVKRANLSAEQITKKRDALQPKEPISNDDQRYINTPGETPNDITSLNESNSAPKLEPEPLSFLANQPSKKSKIEANNIRSIAIFHSFKIENLMDVNPQHKDNKVIVFGKYFPKKLELFSIII